jgi:hypothetical protein
MEQNERRPAAVRKHTYAQMRPRQVKNELVDLRVDGRKQLTLGPADT